MSPEDAPANSNTNRDGTDVVASDLSRYRGVAFVPLGIGAQELATLNEAGARGIRFNIVTTGLPDGLTTEDVLERAIQLASPFGWHLQIFAPAWQIAEVAPVIRSSTVPIVLDHMGGASVEAGLDDPGFRTALKLVEEAHVWVKLSGADRVMGFDMHGFEHVKDAASLLPAIPFARALVEANRQNLIWRTDWPNITHPIGGRGAAAPIATYRDLEANVLLDVLRHAIDDEATWTKVLAENPARLYGY